MCQTDISVWFVCRLCRGSFGQVDAFIEHKKEKHFTQFQNTTCIIFEESEQGLLCPVLANRNHQLAVESNEAQIKIEVNDEDPISPLSSEIIDELDLALVEPKSEFITYENEINPDNDFFGLEQPEQNPYVLLKRLTSEEIQRACVPQQHSTILKCEQKICINSLERPNSSDANSNISGPNECKKSKEIQPTATIEHDLQFECKLCSKQLQSEAQLKIHVGICALYHEDRNRFCVTCNRKFSKTTNLNDHRLRFHATEEEKLSLYKFKCHVCPKEYRHASNLRLHLKSHNQTKEQVETSTSKLLQCSHPNCGKEFRGNSDLQRHISAVHLRLRPFRCHFPKCDRTFSDKANMKRHFSIHTGEHPYKCKVDNCNKRFMFCSQRSTHHRKVHSN